MSNYKIERDKNRCQVVMEGDLTATNAGGLQAALKQELEQGVNELTFDLGRTVMLDSSGIGLLIAAYNTMTRSRGRVQVQNVSAEILQLLQTMRLVTRLNVNGRTTARV